MLHIRNGDTVGLFECLPEEPGRMARLGVADLSLLLAVKKSLFPKAVIVFSADQFSVVADWAACDKALSGWRDTLLTKIFPKVTKHCENCIYDNTHAVPSNPGLWGRAEPRSCFSFLFFSKITMVMK